MGASALYSPFHPAPLQASPRHYAKMSDKRNIFYETFAIAVIAIFLLFTYVPYHALKFFAEEIKNRLKLGGARLVGKVQRCCRRQSV